jgi:uncharacterized protein
MLSHNILMNYYPLIASITSMVSSQTIKLGIMLYKREPIKLAALTRSGGMPSSHSALITSIAASIGLSSGFHSTEFFIATVLSFVVIYDARGIRHAVGTHAKALNTLQPTQKPLNEEVGHTLPEIIIGIAIGLAVSLSMYQFIYF